MTLRAVHGTTGIACEHARGHQGVAGPTGEPDSRHVDVVEATIDALEQPLPLRHELSDILVEAIHEHLRDGDAVVTLEVEGLTRDDLERCGGRYVTAWHRRWEFRGLTGAVVAVIEWKSNE